MPDAVRPDASSATQPSSAPSSDGSMMRAVVYDAPRSLASVGLRPDPALEAWMSRMLARDPAARFRSAAEALVAWYALPVDNVAPLSVPPPSAPAA